uniref:Hexosyltransferase n=1 Tax=Anthurium amnicola TaxID=1678845 RepID=A0A1D1YP29_9ARAE
MRWGGTAGLWFLVALLAVIGAGTCGRALASDEAYVTLLYGDEFLLGVRVLGKSIRDTGTNKDLVVLVSDGVSDYAKRLLQADGWIVELISLLTNPNRVRPKRFWGVYTKLKIFNLTRYKKVVYLDADTIVVKSIEDLFKCRKFCANLKHSERLNSGVMVVEPSEAVYNDMMDKVNSLPSYTGGDQGFLNSYYSGFANAHIFDPSLPSEVRNAGPVPEMERLSTLYNADVGLYMLANKWMVDDKELRVIHYTLGPLKPWDWWTSWLLKPVDIWQNVRKQLEDSLPGTSSGGNSNEQLVVKILFILPLCALIFCYYRSYLQVNNDIHGCRSCICDYVKRIYYRLRTGASLPVYSSVVASSSIANSNHQFSNAMNPKIPSHLGALSVFICFLVAALSLVLAFMMIPRQVMPWTGLLLMYEWTFTIFFVVFGSFLRLIYQWGRATGNQIGSVLAHSETEDYNSGKGHQRHSSVCDVGTWFYGLGMAFLAIIGPSLPLIFGITALFARLGLMVGGGIVLASFMTYASEHLAIRAFVRGLEDRDLQRSRSKCLLC